MSQERGEQLCSSLWSHEAFQSHLWVCSRTGLLTSVRGTAMLHGALGIGFSHCGVGHPSAQLLPIWERCAGRQLCLHLTLCSKEAHRLWDSPASGAQRMEYSSWSLAADPGLASSVLLQLQRLGRSRVPWPCASPEEGGRYLHACSLMGPSLWIVTTLATTRGQSQVQLQSH
jgi:hypothetical protein